MQFNITFFLQIINFYITYWFLNKFMFKPVISFIKKRKKEEINFNKDLEKKEQYLIKLKNKKIENLHEFKSEMKTKYKTKIVNEPIIPSKIEGNVDEKNAQEIITTATKILIEKVPNVD
jgi:F-type H+-transporting ATPase subunit b